MKARILKKVVGTIYDAAARGDFKSAYSRLQGLSPDKQRKVLNIFNEQAFKKLGPKNGTTLVGNFAGYRGLQKGLKSVGGTKGLCEEICQSMERSTNEIIQEAMQKTLKELPQTSTGWAKLILKENWIEAKNAAKTLTSKFKNHVKNKFKLSKSAADTGVKSKQTSKAVKISKKMPDEIKPLLANLEGKSGQEFTDIAYGNIVKHMKLNGIAPKSINIQGEDGLLSSVTGGFDPVKNTITFSQGFLKKLSPTQQINLISHELKHCEQFTNMLRTEGIGVNGYARATAENLVKQALGKSSLELCFKRDYQEALQNGKGEEFIQKATDNMTKQIIPEIERNFSEVLKLPKIKANSSDGLRAVKHLEAQRNYEGLNMLGLGSENYKNNPLEVEAYAFGDNIEKLIKDFVI